MFKGLSFGTLVLCFLTISCGRSAQDYIARGDKSFTSGQYADAELNYIKAAQKDPQSGEAYFKLGRAFIKEDKGVEAHVALQKAVGLLPKDVDSRVALADVTFAFYFKDPRRTQSLYDEITRLASEILSLKPDSADAFRLQGALKLLDGKANEAVELYRKANDLRPANGDIVLGYTQSLLQGGRAGEAENVALAFLKTNPNFPPLYDVLYNQYMAGKRAPEGEAILKQWVEKNPKDPSGVLRLAGHYAGQQRMPEADAVLRQMVDHPANYPLGAIKAGDFYARLGNWPQAIAQYEHGAQAEPKDALAYRKRIVGALLAQGKQDEALTNLDAMIKQAPADEESRTMRARIWIETKKPETLDAAVAELQQLIKDHPKNAELSYELGSAYLLKNDVSAARTHFQEAAQLRRDFLPPRYELAQLALGQENYTDELRLAEEILQVQPADARGRLFRASAFRGLGRLPEARSELRLLTRDYPNYREAYVQTGMLDIQEKKFGEAETIFRALSQGKSDDAESTVGLASAYTAQKQYDRAIQILKDEAVKAPNSVPLANLLAVTAVQAGQYPLAVENLQRVLAANPKSVEAHLNLAEAYRLSGDSNNAAAVLDKARQLNTNEPKTAMLLAAALYNAGQLSQARDAARHAIQLQPNDPTALNNLAFLLVETGGDLNEAQKLAEQAVQKNGTDLHNQDTLGWVYLNKNMTDGAVQIFTTLLKKNPDDPTFHYHLGAALLKKGEKAQARSELQIALTKKPQPADEKSIRQLLAGID